MKQVLASIEAQAATFAELTYFRLLERPGARSDVEIMARGLTFFVMSFQDMLRLNARLISDPTLKKLALGQRKDDAGHDLWFLNDVQKLNLEPDMRWLFSKRHQQTRDTSYEIISQILSAPSDAARLTVGLALEATGGVYFSRVYKFFSDFGLNDGFQFFSRHHWDAEQSHDVFESGVHEQLLALELTSSARAQALAAAASTFGAVARMCEDLSSKMLEARDRQGFVPATAAEVRQSLP
jgi:hypothetical protein